MTERLCGKKTGRVCRTNEDTGCSWKQGDASVGERRREHHLFRHEGRDYDKGASYKVGIREGVNRGVFPKSGKSGEGQGIPSWGGERETSCGIKRNEPGTSLKGKEKNLTSSGRRGSARRRLTSVCVNNRDDTRGETLDYTRTFKSVSKRGRVHIRKPLFPRGCGSGKGGGGSSGRG